MNITKTQQQKKLPLQIDSEAGDWNVLEDVKQTDTKPDEKREDKNDEGKELFNATSEQILTSWPRDKQVIGKKNNWKGFTYLNSHANLIYYTLAIKTTVALNQGRGIDGVENIIF